MTERHPLLTMGAHHPAPIPTYHRLTPELHHMLAAERLQVVRLTIEPRPAEAVRQARANGSLWLKLSLILPKGYATREALLAMPGADLPNETPDWKSAGL